MAKQYASQADLEKDESKLRAKLETAKMNRRYAATKVKQREAELNQAKADYRKFESEAIEVHALLKYGLELKDVEL